MATRYFEWDRRFSQDDYVLVASRLARGRGGPVQDDLQDGLAFLVLVADEREVTKWLYARRDAAQAQGWDLTYCAVSRGVIPPEAYDQYLQWRRVCPVWDKARMLKEQYMGPQP